jgi:small GTP-binding protein
MKKIIIAGLDNSGKSSLLLSFKGIQALSKFTNIEPTRGINQVEIDQFSQNFVIWDIGGQHQNREDFLKEFRTTITETKKLIYVIDIQDRERYDLALDYLKKIINQLKAKNIKVDLSIFLHKFDQNFEIKDLELDSLIKSIKNIIPLNYEYQIHKTSLSVIYKKETLI